MAASYVTLGSKPDVRVVSPVAVADVEAVTISTRPHGWVMVVQVPADQWAVGNDDPYLAAPAELVEQLATQESSGQALVDGVAQVQAIDPSRLLAYFLDLTVVYRPPGGSALPFTAVVRLPFTAFESFNAFGAPLPSGQTPSDVILAAYAQLQKTAGL